MDARERRCVFEICPRPAVAEAVGVIAQWRIALPLCDEHARELGHDTPLGGLAVDRDRVEIEPREGTVAQAQIGFGAVGP